MKKSILLFFALILLASGILLGRLYVEPLRLSFLGPYLTTFLEQETEGGHVTLENPRLRWRGLGHSLEILAENLHVQTSQETGFSLKIPSFYLTFRFRSLALGRFLPSILTLEKPHLSYHPPQSLVVAPTPSEHEMQEASPQDASLRPLGRLLHEVFTPSNKTRALKRVSILGATLSLDLGDSFGLWEIPKATFVLDRKQGVVDGFCDLELTAGQRVQASLAWLAHEGFWNINLTVTSLALPSLLQKLGAQLQNVEEIQGAVSPQHFPLLHSLSKSRLPISGRLNLSLKKDLTLHKATFKLTSKAGILDFPGLLPDKQPYEKASLEGTYQRQKGLNAKGALVTRGTTFEASGKIFLPGGEQPFVDAVSPSPLSKIPLSKPQAPYQVSVHATLKNFLLKDLSGYWPRSSAPPVREWLLHHMPQGKIPQASFKLKGQLDGAFEDFSLQSLGGDLTLEEGILEYLDTMPKITGLFARAHFDTKHFAIEVRKGLSNGLALDSGLVLITGLEGPHQDIKIRTQVRGPLNKALDLISREPLAALEGTNIKASPCQGMTTTELHLQFPLDERFATDRIQFAAHSHVTGFIPRPLSLLPVDLRDVDIQLEVTNDQLEASGHAKLNGVPSDLAWQRSLNPQKTSETLRLQLPLTQGFLKSLGYDVTSYLTGRVPAEILYKRASLQNSSLEVSLNLTPAQLEFGSWRKEKNRPGKATSKWLFKNHELVRLENFHLKTHILEIDGTASFGPKTRLQKATLKTFKFGKTDLRGHLLPGKDVAYKLFIEGPRLDLSPFLEALKAPSTTEFPVTQSFDLRLRVPQIKLFKGRQFFQNSLNLRFFNDRIHSVSYKGFLSPDVTKEFYIDVFPRANNGRRLRLKCQDAGYMLKALNLFDDVVEGRLKLTANQKTDAPQAPWKGKLEIESFWLQKAPILSRLLSLAFPTGLVNAFSEKGLPFERLKIKFKKSGDRLSLHRGRSYSPGFGFSINGSLTQHLSYLNIHGTVYPAYFFNTFFSRIPLLGKLLTGGKHEGIWGVSYTIKGPSPSPTIQVNPLTVFAPGIFRTLFLSSEGEEFEELEEEEEDGEEKEDDDDDDDQNDDKGGSFID